MPLVLAVLVLALAGQSTSLAQQQPAPLTIQQAVQQAVEKYPAARAAAERVSASSAATQLARTAYLPRADFLAQLDRATRNNVFGLTLPAVRAALPSPDRCSAPTA